MATLARFDDAYHRFLGTLEIDVVRDGEVIEHHEEDKALWELMYFGRPPRRAETQRDRGTA